MATTQRLSLVARYLAAPKGVYGSKAPYHRADENPMRPLCTITLSFAAGIIIAHCGGLPVVLFPGLALCAVLALSNLRRVQGAHLVRLSRLNRTVYVLTAALIAGGFCLLTQGRPSARDPAHLAPLGQTIPLAGLVLSLETHASHTEVVLQTGRLYIDSLRLRISGKILLTLPSAPTFVTPGTTVLARATRLPVYGKRNPAGFDYQAYLQRRGIHARFKCETIQVLEPPSTPRARGLHVLYQTRNRVRSTLKRYAPSTPSYGLLSALLLGDTGHVPDPLVEDFRAAGLSHLLAVSGLHVLCIGLLVYRLLPAFLLRMGFTWRSTEIVRVVTVLFLLSAFMVLTGGKSSVIRATCMTSVWILSPVVQRPSSPLNSLALAALLIVASRPLAVFDVGFQLSFAAVLGLLTLYPILTSLLPRSGTKKGFAASLFAMCIATFNASLAALLATLPLTLYHFDHTSLSGLVLNTVAIPVTMFCMIAGLLMLMGSLFSSLIAAFFADLAGALCHVLAFIADAGSTTLSLLDISSGTSLRTTLCMSFALVLFTLCAYRSIRWKCVLAGLALGLSIYAYDLVHRPAHPVLSVLFFDVGHGDAALIGLPNGKQLVIDTGRARRNKRSNVISRHLEHLGRDTVDAVILTHPHSDHTGGLSGLQHSATLSTLYSNSGPGHTPHVSLVAGDALHLDPTVRIRVLAPTRWMLTHTNVNNHSIIILIEYGETRFLFLGDAERDAERALISRYAALLPGSEVIKVAHHGSSTSSTKYLLDAITRERENVEVAVISSGRGGEYGLPDEDVVDRWRHVAERVHLTARSGALWLYSNGRKINDRAW